jgi:hypothetical protein
LFLCEEFVAGYEMPRKVAHICFIAASKSVVGVAQFRAKPCLERPPSLDSTWAAPLPPASSSSLPSPVHHHHCLPVHHHHCHHYHQVGFINAVIHEVADGQPLAEQAATLGPVSYAVLGAWVVATLVPICKGVRNNEAFGAEWLPPVAGLCYGFAGCAVAVNLRDILARVPFRIR